MSSDPRVPECVPFDPREQAEFGAVETLLHLEAIRNLKSRYLAAVDFKDWDAMREIFTEDAVIDFSGEGQYHVGHHGVTEKDVDPDAAPVIGGEAAGTVIAAAVGHIIAVHQCHDPQIALTSETTARGRWSLYDRLDYGTEVMHGYGHYVEDYRLESGRWRIAYLLLTRLRVVWESVPNG